MPRKHAHTVSAVETSYTPTGVLGIGKNKGGVALAMKLRNTPLCFINSHLAAHQDKVIQRNQDVRNILRSTRLGSTMCELTTQYHTIWMGDLNYRIDKHTRKEAVRLIEANQLGRLAQDDQLRAEIAGSRAFHGFEEAGDLASCPYPYPYPYPYP